MARTTAIILAALWAAGAAHGAPVLERAASAYPMHYSSVDARIGGRVAEDHTWISLDNPYIHRLVYQWPGTYFEAAFKGPQIYFQLDDSLNILDVLVDGKPIGQLNKPGHAQYRVTGLSSGAHLIRVERRSESMSGTADFEGFALPFKHRRAAPELPPPPPRSRQVEIIGDSYAAGYGTTSTKHECTPDEIHDTTDTQQAFGPLLAKHYDADYQINAVSGIGMVRNYDGSAGPVIPDIYPFTLFDKSVPYNDVSWQPRIVVIALGDNDFATPVKPGEKWVDFAALRADFIATYETFVKGIRAHNPNATFILMDYGEPELIPDLQTITADLTAAGDTRILTFSPGTNFEQTGCDWHLSLNDHKRIASGLEAFIDSHPTIWQ